ncbi:uncharacterized protein DNG_07198 [Cephalotrichum gorgonifer]|uniref:Sin3-associated polypeptide Sap18 n=1 Tax=Cephalotrichum gorgonifer TaxID=2041049 RepID=A0AAE8SX86_9PEZI|nr:uncharacterized protein DNG_07198 [Cephalotrichum gorgonifer]
MAAAHPIHHPWHLREHPTARALCSPLNSNSARRPEDFTSRNPPPHVAIYTHQTCTLSDLAAHLTALSPPSLLPSPPIGTRLAFQLAYPDLRNPAAHQRRYLVKDLGSLVIGGALRPDDQLEEDDEVSDEGKTLADAKFVVGDYVSCVVLPPLEDGSVAPLSMARRDKHVGREDGRSGGGGFGGGSGAGAGSFGFGGNESFPAGNWNRGQRVPHGPTRPRGGGRRY